MRRWEIFSYKCDDFMSSSGKIIGKACIQGFPLHPDHEGKSPLFIDRDYKYFDVNMSVLRHGGNLPQEVLQRDLRQLHELRTEAKFYQLDDLT